MTPSVRRSRARWERDRRPLRNVPTRTVPEVGLTSCVMSLSTVVLPAPLGPRSTRHSPSSMCQETESSARRSPNRFVTSSNVIMKPHVSRPPNAVSMPQAPAVTASTPSRVADLDVGLGPQLLHPLVVAVPLLHLGDHVGQLFPDLVERVFALGLAVVDLEDVEARLVDEDVADLPHLERVEPGADLRLERGHRDKADVAIRALGPVVLAVAPHQGPEVG